MDEGILGSLAGLPVLTSKFLPEGKGLVVGSVCKFCGKRIPNPMSTPLALMPVCAAEGNFGNSCAPEVVVFDLSVLEKK